MVNNGGFTLIEAIIVMVIMTVVGAISLPVSIDYQQRNDLDVAQVSFVQGLRRAQQLSMAGENDSAWGVTFTSGNIVVFKGNTYATRDVAYDENYGISPSITASGQTEYDIAKITGLPSQAGSITLNNGNYAKVVGVNAKAVVNY
jgi:prepilin-type N-terminal cleavage/methylation domain-containing protein